MIVINDKKEVLSKQVSVGMPVVTRVCVFAYEANHLAPPTGINIEPNDTVDDRFVSPL